MSMRIVLDERAIAMAEQGAKVLKAADFERISTADTIIRDAVKKSKEVEQEAREAYEFEKQRGYQEGLDLGRGEIATRLTELTAEYAESVTSLQESLIGILPSLVRKVIGTFDDAELVVKLVNGTVNSLSAEKKLRLSVSPELADAVEQRKHQIMAAHPMIEFVEVVKNPQLGERICEVESETLSVRLDIDEQLEKIETIIQQSLA
jgi:type III secretion protein L